MTSNKNQNKIMGTETISTSETCPKSHTSRENTKIVDCIMKKENFKIILVSILSMLSVYSYADCIETSFKENYLKNFKKNEVFFIKGVALDIFEYGRTIKVIEDLKGNYTGKSSIFVWGTGKPPSGIVCETFERWDIITQYQENDTLIMLLQPVVFENCLETLGEYTTITCAYSVLKLSSGFVTGYIYPWGELWGETTISWEELQELLSNSTAIQSVKIQNNIYQQNGTVFFENSESKAVKLSFYDLCGKLVHEATTTFNSYNPVLTGNIFVCKIIINDKLHTIKYIVP